NERYSLIVLPFYLLLAGATLTASPGRGAGGGSPRAGRLRMGIVALVVAASLVAAVREQIRVLAQQPLETLGCAETLRRLARPGDRVIARKPNLAFHAGVTSVYFPPTDSLEVLARLARSSGARWLFVSAPEILLRPHTAYLLDTSTTLPGLVRRA